MLPQIVIPQIDEHLVRTRLAPQFLCGETDAAEHAGDVHPGPCAAVSGVINDTVSDLYATDFIACVAWRRVCVVGLKFFVRTRSPTRKRGVTSRLTRSRPAGANDLRYHILRQLTRRARPTGVGFRASPTALQR